jgi:hypothetical protein
VNPVSLWGRSSQLSFQKLKKGRHVFWVFERRKQAGLMRTSGAYSLLAMIQQAECWRYLSEKMYNEKGQFFLLCSKNAPKKMYFGRTSVGREDLDSISAIIHSYVEAE